MPGQTYRQLPAKYRMSTLAASFHSSPYDAPLLALWESSNGLRQKLRRAETNSNDTHRSAVQAVYHRMWRFFLLLLVAWLVRPAEPGAESLMNNGHWKRARTVAEQAFQTNPNDARANYWMARIRRQFKALDEAEKYASSAIRLQPNVSAYHLELAE